MMARTPDPDTLRLSGLDPDTLAQRCAEAAAVHVGRLSMALSPRYTLHIDETGESEGPPVYTEVGMTLADLTRYAQTGAPLDDLVEDYAINLMPLFASPLSPPSGPLPPVLRAWLDGEVDLSELSADSLEDALALVVTAALGRQQLDGGDPLSAAQLAALGSVDPRTVRRLVQSGELAGGDPSAIPAEEARRWLSGRGVKGL